MGLALRQQPEVAGRRRCDQVLALRRQPRHAGDRDHRFRHRREPLRLRPRPGRGAEDDDEPQAELGWRWTGSWNVCGVDRGGRGARVRRCRSRCADRLDRRHGRQGHGHDERRHRLGRLDPRQQGSLQHQGRELLAPLGGPEQLHVRPARKGGREALVRRCDGRGVRGQLRRQRRAVRRATTRPAAIRSSSRSAPPTSAALGRPPTTRPPRGRPTATRSTASPSPS